MTFLLVIEIFDQKGRSCLNFLKGHKSRIFLPLFLCIFCAAVVSFPYVNKAGGFEKYSWTVYKSNSDHCQDGHTDHLVLTQNDFATDMEFYGHQHHAFFEYAIANPGQRDRIENEFFSFTYSDGVTDAHTLSDGGFLFNVTNDGANITSGYMIAYDCFGKVNLYYITGGEGGTQTQPDRTLIASVSSKGGVHQVAIQATAGHIVYIDNNKTLFDMDLKYDATGTSFGPYVQWIDHDCNSESSRFFKNISCGINKHSPIIDFDYNQPIIDIGETVYVKPSIKDGNTPASSLTTLWTVEKKNEDGSWSALCVDQPYPFTKYNESGVGVYRTTLKVKNEYCYSSTVTKEVEITTDPRITISVDKAQYYPGDTVIFKDSNWYNCNTLVGDIIIENVVSKNLHSPSIKLVGSSDISGASGDLLVNLKIEYFDGTSYIQTLSVPPSGRTITDDSNAGKPVSKITTTYKSMPGLAKVAANKGITYSFATNRRLFDYYSGGGAPRRYEITNTVTSKVLLGSRYATATDSAQTILLDRNVSFSLSGTINNNGAITVTPSCNTEFLLSGTSSGGENISRYIVVSEGKSPLVELPYGEYTLNEELEFTVGYDLINPIAITLDERGITYGSTTVPNKGAVDFVKSMQVTNIRISRVYESDDVPLRSDTEFAVSLTGSPVIKGIQAKFDLTSPQNDPLYYYDGKTTLTVPIGTYKVKETKAFRLVSLENISVNDKLLWDRVLNIKEDNSSVHRGTFTSSKNQTSSIVLKYIPDEYAYDEKVYENSLHFNAAAVSKVGSELTSMDVDRVAQNPRQYKYPITLINDKTDEKYCGIIEPGTGIVFSYMRPGKYTIECSNNMYMNLRELREINSDSIEFGFDAGEYYLIIPDRASGGRYEEETGLTDWRGYSSISTEASYMFPEVNNHVSLRVKSFDQDEDIVGGCSFEFYKDGGPVYFLERDGRLYPSIEEADNSDKTFSTDENGLFEIYKFPIGEFDIKVIPPEGYLATEPVQKISVKNSRNMGVFIELVDKGKLRAPISIELLSSKMVIDINESIQLADKITPSTAYRNVVFESSDNSTVSVDESGKITGHKKGTAVITVKSDLDNSVVGEIEITVKDPNAPDIRDLRQIVSNINLDVGEKYNASATYCPSDIVSTDITWTSENPSIASVASDGTITANSVGSVDITALCNGVGAICHVVVGDITIPVESISLATNNIRLIYNHPTESKGKIEASISPNDATDPTITFVSSNPDIVSVDVNGNLTAKSAGTVTITVQASNGLNATCLVSSVPIAEEISFNIDSMSIIKGSSAPIAAVVSPINSINEKDLAWQSLDTNIATVDDSGNVTAIGIGQTTVVATISYPGVPSVTAECTVNVLTDEVPPTNLDACLNGEFTTLEIPDTVEMIIGDTVDFFSRIRPASSTFTEVEWTCEPSNIVSIIPADFDNSNHIPENKLVNKWKIAADKGIGGEVKVTGRIKGTDVATQFDVIVDEPGTGFSLSATDRQLIVLKDPYDKLPVGLIYNELYSRATSINWSISDESKATISYPDDSRKEVIVTGHKVGTVTLTCEVEFRVGGKYTQTVEIDIEEPRIDVLVNGVPIDEITIMRGTTQDFVVRTNYPSDPNTTEYTMTFSNPRGIASAAVSGNNITNGKGYTLTGLKVDSSTLTITPADPYTPSKTINVNIIRNPSIHEHETFYLTDKAATCTTAGYKAHYECSCGCWFTDSLGDNEITNKTPYIIPALGHTLSYHVVDSNYHNQVCSVCGHTTANSVHVYSNNVCIYCGYTCPSTASGYVNNATNLARIPGATLRFRSGSGATSGTVVGTTTSDSSGNFTIGLPAGTYTAEVSASGFVTAYVTMVSSSTGGSHVVSLSPLQSEGDIRAVLTWGTDPRDLDTHLEGTHNGAAVNVYYGSKTFSNIITLDVDNTSGGGPETLSISWDGSNQNYVYWIQDYTNKSNTTSTAMSNSGATVSVYQSNRLVATVSIPTGQAGTRWNVFTVSASGQISVINQVVAS